MKKMMIAAAAVLLSGCFSPVEGELGDVIDETEGAVSVRTKKFTFTMKGDFGNANFTSGDSGITETRGYMSADGQDMTDLWVFDYMGDSLVQRVHQTATDVTWGAPQMSLSYGSHVLYFVAARGDSAAVDTAASLIMWNIPRDTFWKSYAVTVASTSNGNRAVTLDRIVTKLKLTVLDEIPSGCSTLTVVPAVWYYGLNYRTGEPSGAINSKERTVNVPATYVGTSGQVNVSIFGMSGADEWTTDVTLTAKDGSNAVMGTVTIPGVPFKRNRVTDYRGSLFGSAGLTDVGLSSEWEAARTGTW